MCAFSLAAELPKYGPAGTAAPSSVAEAEAYCKRLATSHYENFVVAGVLVPRALRPHFYNVYAYCRWSDDLADEVGDAERSLQLLDWWEAELRACYAGQTRHPVFTALRGTITEFGIPPDPFVNLLTAFRQDQRQTRYETFEDLLAYCRNSADPVGRLVLYLARRHDEQLLSWSDSICTGLQLANFWQDVARDFAKGRVYLPQRDLAEFRCPEVELNRKSASATVRRVLKHEVERAEKFLRDGLPLVEAVPRELSGSIWMFAHGGLKILEKIRRQDYDVLARRPKVSKVDQVRWLAGCLWRNKLRGGGPR